jgi:hypothetical protein
MHHAARLDRTGCLRQPHLHPALGQPRQQLAELIAEECPLVLPHHDRVE